MQLITIIEIMGKHRKSQREYKWSAISLPRDTHCCSFRVSSNLLSVMLTHCLALHPLTASRMAQRLNTKREEQSAFCFIYFSSHPCFFHKFSQVSLTTLCNMWNSIYTFKTTALQNSNLSESTAPREMSNILLSTLIKVEHIKFKS